MTTATKAEQNKTALIYNTVEITDAYWEEKIKCLLARAIYTRTRAMANLRIADGDITFCCQIPALPNMSLQASANTSESIIEGSLQMAEMNPKPPCIEASIKHTKSIKPLPPEADNTINLLLERVRNPVYPASRGGAQRLSCLIGAAWPEFHDQPQTMLDIVGCPTLHPFVLAVSKYLAKELQAQNKSHCNTHYTNNPFPSPNSLNNQTCSVGSTNQKKGEYQMSATKVKRAKPIKGICADAKTLGVRREHLYLVLKGKRVSARLTRKYNELKKQQNT